MQPEIFKPVIFFNFQLKYPYNSEFLKAIQSEYSDNPYKPKK